MLRLREMSEVHDCEAPSHQGTPSPQALAEELSITCPTCQVEVGAWCGVEDGLVLVHPERLDAFYTLAREKVTNKEWEYIRACDHGSHHYCYPCMANGWMATDDMVKCAGCGLKLDGSWVTSEGSSWHIRCAPEHLVRRPCHCH